MLYREFVKANFHKLPASMAAKDKMRKIGEMWRASGHAKGNAKGGRVVGGKVARKRVAKNEEGGDFFSDVILPKISMGLLGGDVEEGGKVSRRVRKTKQEGAGFFSDALGSIGLGVEGKKRKTKRGGALDEQGGGIFSSVLGSIGLGMNPKVLQKHHNRMIALEKKMHTNGRLTPKEHHKLRVYHHLDGAGFFSSLFGGVKSLANKVADNIGAIKEVVPEVIKLIPSSVKDKAIAMLPKSLAMPVSMLSKLV